MTALFVLLVYVLSMALLAALELRRIHQRAEQARALRRLRVEHRLAAVLHWTDRERP